MVFFYRRFLPLDVYKYAFGAENDVSYSNLPIPLVKPKEAVSNFAFETASYIFLILLEPVLADGHVNGKGNGELNR